MRSRWLAFVVLGAVVIVFGLLWKLTPLADVVQPAHLAAQLDRVGNAPWGPAAMLAIYVIGGFVLMPLLALITATALVFDPLPAIAITMTGSLLNAAAVYFAAAKFLRGRAERSFGEAIGRVRNALQSRGVIAVAMLRLLPVAPFSLVNLAAGSIGVRFRDFMIGTALGLAPGVVLMSVFGHELKDLVRDPSLSRVLTVVGIAAAWVLLSLAIQRFVSRRRASA
ncbi:MAG: VTT domain-containing protein [Gammaproteobacteria bacterium]